MNIFYIFAIVVVIVAILTLVLRKKLLLFSNLILKAFFILSILAFLISVFFPSSFDYLALKSIENSELPERIKYIDDKITFKEVTDSVDDFRDEFDNYINEIFPDFNDEENIDIEIEEIGPLEAQLYPLILTFVANIYRWTTFVLSLIGIILTIYLSYSTQATADLAKLEQKIAEIEQNLAKN